MTAEQIAIRMQWLAYQASKPMGMGWLHFANDKTEADIRDAVSLDTNRCSSDYLFGRMVKCRIPFKDGAVAITDCRPPEADYQSWSHAYPTYAALHDAAVKSLAAG
jgi:hypothetical protein